MLMTKSELKAISQEIDSIDTELSFLDPGNAIESQRRDRLFCRLEFLDYQLQRALILARRSRIQTITCTYSSYKKKSAGFMKAERKPSLRIIS